MDAKPILNKWFSEDDYESLAKTTAAAYKACDQFLQGNAVTSSFLIGVEQRSLLINTFVQHGLMLYATKHDNFFYDFKPNAANNCHHIELHSKLLTMTAHFLGRKCDRRKARSAIHKAVLASRNYDFFDGEVDISEQGDVNKHIYCNLLHGGMLRPDYIGLVIPTVDQTNYSHSMALPNPEPELTEAEQIREEMTLKILSEITDQDEQDRDAG